MTIRDPGLPKGLKALLAYGLPLTAAGLAGTVGFQFDRVVVGTSFPPSDFAVSALGAVEIPLGLLLGQAATHVLVPALSDRSRTGDCIGMVALWREAMQKMSLILLPLLVFLMVMADDLIPALCGPGYDESVLVLRIYLFLIPLRVANWGIVPTAIGRTRMYASAGLIRLAANAVIALTSAGPLGLARPALAAPIATALAAAYYLLRSRPILGAGGRRLVPFGSLSKSLAAALASVPLILIRTLALPPAGRFVLAACAYSAIVVPALRLSGQIADDDWHRIRLPVVLARQRRRLLR